MVSENTDWCYFAITRAQELASLPLWTSSAEGDFIARSFVAKNFVAAMAFLNGVAEVAEEQGHHPDLHLTQYRNVEIRLQTHSMGGENRRHGTGAWSRRPYNRADPALPCRNPGCFAY